MILDVVEAPALVWPNTKSPHAEEKHYWNWIEHPSSSITHHGQRCCESARLWLLALARSREAWAMNSQRLRPPTWLAEKFEWGPSPWPIAWCEVFQQRTIDCGVFAALAREIFAAQGLSAHPAQALLRYNSVCTDHWKDLWRTKTNASAKGVRIFPWVGDQIVYHEVCIVDLPGGEGRIFDSTFGNWLEPVKRDGFAALVAVRSECPRLIRWGDLVLSCGEWVDL